MRTIARKVRMKKLFIRNMKLHVGQIDDVVRLTQAARVPLGSCLPDQVFGDVDANISSKKK